MLTERGVSFGYNNLVVDMRSFPIMHEFEVPVVFDVTHSLQLPGGLGHATGGLSQYIEPLARAGVACGVDAVFMEVHDAPDRAPSDGPNMLPLARMAKLLDSLRDIHALVHNRNEK
jgi:2-dehydro-3-deoxyphosphooctonate aldolase (KDO 8-P synthase)